MKCLVLHDPCLVCFDPVFRVNEINVHICMLALYLYISVDLLHGRDMAKGTLIPYLDKACELYNIVKPK